VFQDAAMRAIEEAGFRVLRPKSVVHPGAELTLSILDGIQEADLVVADVSRHNPNVFYELGFAHPVLTTQRSRRA
jgi:hypothetical protein